MIPSEPCTETLTWYQVAVFPKSRLASLLNPDKVEQLIQDLLRPESVQECQQAFPNIEGLRNIPFRIVSRVIRYIQISNEEQINRLSQAMTNARIWPELSFNTDFSYSRHHELYLAIRKAAIKGNFVASGFFLEHFQSIKSPSDSAVPKMSTQDRKVTGELIKISLCGQLNYNLLKQAVQKVFHLSIQSRHCMKVALEKMVAPGEHESLDKKQRIFWALADVPNDELEGVAAAFQQWDVNAVFKQYDFCMPVVRTEIIKILRALAPEHRDLFRELYSTKFNDHGKLIPLLCTMNEEVRSLVYELIREKNWEKEKPIKRYVKQIAPCSVEEAEEIYKIHQYFEEPLDFYSETTILEEIKNTPQVCRQEVADIVASILKPPCYSSKPLSELIPKCREDLKETFTKWFQKAITRRCLDALIPIPKSRYDSYHDSLKKTLIAALTSIPFPLLEELFPALKQVKFEDLSRYSKDLLAILSELNPAHRELFATLFSTRSTGEGELIGIVCSVKGSKTESKIYKLIESSRWTFLKDITRFVELIYPCSFEEARELYNSYKLFKDPMDYFPLDLGLMSEIKSLPAGNRVETTRKAAIIASSNRMIEKDFECIGRLGKLDPEDQEEVFQAICAWKKIGYPKDLIDTFAAVPRGQRLAYGEAVLCYAGWSLLNLQIVKNSAPEKRAEVCAAMIYFKDEKMPFDGTIKEIIAQVQKLPVGESQEFCEALKLLNNGNSNLSKLMPALELVPVGDRVPICEYFPDIFKKHSHIAWNGTANRLIQIFSKLDDEQRKRAQQALLKTHTALNWEIDSYYERVVLDAVGKSPEKTTLSIR